MPRFASRDRPTMCSNHGMPSSTSTREHVTTPTGAPAVTIVWRHPPSTGTSAHAPSDAEQAPQPVVRTVQEKPANGYSTRPGSLRDMMERHWQQVLAPDSNSPSQSPLPDLSETVTLEASCPWAPAPWAPTVHHAEHSAPNQQQEQEQATVQRTGQPDVLSRAKKKHWQRVLDETKQPGVAVQRQLQQVGSPYQEPPSQWRRVLDESKSRLKSERQTAEALLTEISDTNRACAVRVRAFLQQRDAHNRLVAQWERQQTKRSKIRAFIYEPANWLTDNPGPRMCCSTHRPAMPIPRDLHARVRSTISALARFADSRAAYVLRNRLTIAMRQLEDTYLHGPLDQQARGPDYCRHHRRYR